MFVYGLLRSDQSMHDLLDGSRDLGVATLDGYDLLDLGRYPGAIPGDGTIVGELIELRDEEQLSVLDQAEGCDRTPPLYERVDVTVRGKSAWLYVYAGDTKHVPRVVSGDWARR